MNKLLALISFLTVFNMFDFTWELRFIDTRLNYLFVMSLAALLPITLFLWSAYRKSTLAEMIGLGASLCLAVPCYLVFIVAKSNAAAIGKNGVDASFEAINRISNGAYQYVLYRTNGGATTSFGLMLRKERELGLGLKVVSVLYSKYPASQSTLELTEQSQIKMLIQPYSKHDQPEVVKLAI
ncbi:hypothetical protein [Pseudoalteromonas sp. OOF1S-7]|uniref:hypothetical protein n=1 Tax=Pseudoalteromonas sp. OOF1S-7 TaxID=2917757 RepID=UPI001EF4FD72|nr:hypothetical protein [Pseudoalteromonas sp. OOF1S-7]MCG7533687.1 hypothetical protein [Pseudoalteromonas sp. OOF1S-7]